MKYDGMASPSFIGANMIASRILASAIVFLAGACLEAQAQNLSGAFEPDPAPASVVGRSSPVWRVPFTGIDMAPGSTFGYGGILVAPSGDFTKSGFILRAFGGYGAFDYDSAAVPGGKVNGRVALGDVMIGYQTFGEFYRLAGYIGVEHQDISLSPFDPTATVVGGETGFKAVGEFETNQKSKLYLNLMASYSTAFDSFSARVRPGYRFDNVIIGPEGGWQENRSSENQRAGGFVTVNHTINPSMYLSVTGYGGYVFVGKDSSGPSIGGSRDGPYGGLVLALTY